MLSFMYSVKRINLKNVCILTKINEDSFSRVEIEIPKMQREPVFEVQM